MTMPRLPTLAAQPRRLPAVLTRISLVLVAAALLGGAAQAADDSPASTAGSGDGAVQAKVVPGGDRQPSGTVVVFNRPIYTFRSTFLGIPPRERAATARSRILALLERGGDEQVTVDKFDRGAVIKVGGSLAFVIANEDVPALDGETLEEATGGAVRALQRAIAETHEARDGRLMLAAAIWAGGATVVYGILLALLRFIGRAVTHRMLRLADSTAERVRIGGAEILHRERATRFVGLLLRIGYWAFVILLTYEWIGFVLGRFPFTRAWSEDLNAFLVTTTVDMLTAVARSIPDLLIVAVIIVVARAVNGLLRSFFDGVQSSRIEVAWLDADSSRPTRRLATIAIWVFALVMAYPYIPGSGTEAFKGLSVLLGLMVSIGASGIVGQAASGLILMYTRTFRPGEYVRINDHEGTIVEMGMFTTRIRTGLGEELTVPNALVLGAVTKNYSRAVKGPGFVLDTTVTIGYDAPWRQVHAMLIEAARRTGGVLSDPTPRVFQIALSDFYVEYRLVCLAVPTEPRPRAEVLSSLHANVQDVFNEHGVQIMSPHYLGDPADPKVVPKARWHESPAEPPR
jgi:small-conductance mechanosensitive channel